MLSPKLTELCTHSERHKRGEHCNGCSGHDFGCPQYKPISTTHYQVPKYIMGDIPFMLLQQQAQQTQNATIN